MGQVLAQTTSFTQYSLQNRGGYSGVKITIKINRTCIVLLSTNIVQLLSVLTATIFQSVRDNEGRHEQLANFPINEDEWFWYIAAALLCFQYETEFMYELRSSYFYQLKGI